MSPPPVVLLAESARRNHVSEESGVVAHALVQELVNEARRRPELLDLSTNRISRAVRAYVAAGASRERDLVSWVIAYADPTGETAVRNVLRVRGW